MENKRNNKDISDGCGCLLSVALIVFILLTLGFQSQLLDAFEAKYIY